MRLRWAIIRQADRDNERTIFSSSSSRYQQRTGTTGDYIRSKCSPARVYVPFCILFSVQNSRRIIILSEAILEWKCGHIRA